MKRVFVSGGTGYLGQMLVRRLLERGHDVHVLARPGSEAKVPRGAQVVAGNALDAATFSAAVAPCDTFVQLTGVAHPAPWKERQFRAIDLVSLRASALAAKAAGVSHFVYVSVAQPAPIMQAYIRVRQECEAYLAELGLTATILRPWYVLGPGHWWPVALKPVYAMLARFESTRASAERLGLVTRAEMVAALVWAVENPATGTNLIEVPAIRKIAESSTNAT
jgi:uncharacterized protein YbjT (DUF2867 family)